MRIPGADRAIENLLKWSTSDDWEPYLAELFAEHFEPVCDQFEIAQEEIADLLGAPFGMIYGCVLEDFFSSWFGEEGERNVIDDYLKRRGWREKVPARRYLEAMRDSVLSLYEVVDLDPGHSLTVKDLIRGGDPVTVSEERGSESAARWDRLAGRIVTVNKAVCFTGALLLFPREAADQVLSAMDDMVKDFKKELRSEARKRGEPAEIEDAVLRGIVLAGIAPLFIQIWLEEALARASRPLPQMQNSDGEDILFSEARFPIAGEAERIVALLDQIEDLEREGGEEPNWVWQGAGSPSERLSQARGRVLGPDDKSGDTVLGRVELLDDALLFSTNSKERADRGRALLLARLEGLVGPPLTSHRGVEDMLAAHADAPSGPPEVPAEVPAEVAEQAIHAFMDRHFRQTLDDPIPYFDGKTPRQAARSKKGRLQVIAWLKDLENNESRRAARAGQRPYDVRWMWREMKIDYPG